MNLCTCDNKNGREDLAKHIDELIARLLVPERHPAHLFPGLAGTAAEVLPEHLAGHALLQRLHPETGQPLCFLQGQATLSLPPLC